MKDISLQIRNAIFYVLVPIFDILGMALGRLIKLHFLVIAVLAITFGVLGLVLVVLTARLRESKIQKLSFILVGASAAGIPMSLFYLPGITARRSGTKRRNLRMPEVNGLSTYQK